MLTRSDILEVAPLAIAGIDLPGRWEKHEGQTRDTFTLPGDKLALVVTDRLTAFGHMLGLIPYKGQVLNQLAAFWFERTEDIIPNHVLDVPDPNVTIARKADPLPVSVVVRGYLTGVTPTSLWYHYERGERTIYGIRFPDGLRKNDALLRPVITTVLHGQRGQGAELLSAEEVLKRGLVTPEMWERVTDLALAIFRRGEKIAEEAGLILVDAMYEFGTLSDGSMILIDEIHTPESARFWLAGSYAARKAAGMEPENFDKEFIHLWLAEQWYEGAGGSPPSLPDEMIVAVAQRYIRVYEYLTGREFEPAPYPAQERISAALKPYLEG